MFRFENEYESVFELMHYIDVSALGNVNHTIKKC